MVSIGGTNKNSGFEEADFNIFISTNDGGVVSIETRTGLYLW